MEISLKEKLMKNINAFSQKRYFEKHLSANEKAIVLSQVGSTIGEKIYCFCNDIVQKPLCKCGKELKFKSFKEGYMKYCSVSCRAKNQLRTKEQYDKMLTTYKNTMVEKYGVENSFQLESVKKKISDQRDASWYKARTEKSKETSKKHYGCEWPTKSSVIKSKIANTQNKLYGGLWGNKTHENRSKNEIYIYKTIKKVFTDTRHNDRTAIKPFELDIYVPSIKLAIEYNGEHWHCLHGIDHRKKYSLCKEKGIKLVQIWENDFKNYKDDIIENIFNIAFNQPYTKNFYIFSEDEDFIYQDACWPPYKNNYVCLTEQYEKTFLGFTCLDNGKFIFKKKNA